MSEKPPQDQAPWRPDDDRLLGYVLGLGDDAGLEEAAAEDEGLRRRLDQLRVETSAIADMIARVVPDPEDGYADVSLPRWNGLRPFLGGAAEGPEAPTRRRGGPWRWWRVLAPAAAVILVAVGVAVALQQQHGSGVAGLRDAPAPEAAVSGPSASDDRPAKTALDARALERFAVVVVARARRVSDGLQQFDVVRVLRGAAPARLALHVKTTPAAEGRLHLLCLVPRDVGAAWPSPAASGAAQAPRPGLLPSPLTTGGPDTAGVGSPGSDSSLAEGALLFGDNGADVLVMTLPIGVEARDVSLP